MRARVFSADLDGPDAPRIVPVDASLAAGAPGLVLRGPAADERLEHRVRVALGRCGHALAPCQHFATLTGIYRRANPGVALAIVAAVLAAHGIVPRERLAGALVWGELDDEGTLAPTSGADQVAALARAHGLRLVVPAESQPSDTSGLALLPIVDVAQLAARLRDELPFAGWLGPSRAAPLALVRVRAALELMLAGRHHALAAVTRRETSSLVRRLAALLPEPDEALAAERTTLALVGADPLARVLVLDPTTPIERLLGTHPAAPGPACLAHGGVLVLDDVHRYPPALRRMARRAASGWEPAPRPADFTLLATIRPREHSPAPLGRPRELDCVTLVAERHTTREAQALEPTQATRSRITLARARQLHRFGGRWPGCPWTCNAQIPSTPNMLDEFCATSESGRALLDRLTHLHRWTNHQRADLLRVARTLADLDPDRDPWAPLDRECLASAAIFMPKDT